MQFDEKNAQPEQIMEQVREHVREQSLAEGGEALEEFRLLLRDVKRLRENLAENSSDLAKLSQEIPELNYEAFGDLDDADSLQDIPAPEEIARFAPLHFLYKAWRKGTLKSQRLFNHSVAKLFRHSFQNMLRLERGQLALLEQVDQMNRHLEALEKKLPDQSLENKSDS